MIIKLLIIACVVLLGSSCSTLRKQSARKPIVDLHLDPSWRCAPDKDATVCHPTDQDELIKVIAWTAKTAGPQDSISAYHERLKAPRKVRHRLRMASSTPISDDTVTIAETPWVDAEQANSEIFGFNTRYLATVKDGLAIVITFSARKDIYAEFKKQTQGIIDHVTINPPAPAAP